MSAQVHNESPEIEAVRFSGGALQVLRDAEGKTWMLLRPACKALELDADGQRILLERAVWSVACVMKAAGKNGKQRSFYCLRGDRVAMWLATVSIKRARPELRERRIKWQCEAADALARWAVERAPAQQCAPSPAPSPLTPELRLLIAQEVRSTLQQERASTPPPSQPSNKALAYGILLRRPEISGWPQLALGLRQSCRFLKSDCSTTVKLAELLEYDPDAVPELVGAVEKLTGRRTLSGRQLGYLLSCAHKRGLVEHDGRFHSRGGYGWRALASLGSPEQPRLPAVLSRNVVPIVTEQKSSRATKR